LIVFIDETGAKTTMARLYGRAPRGQRLLAAVPHGHGMTTTFVAALRHNEITAPCVFDGPMDGASFLTYVAHFLAPTLRNGDIVRMDNSPPPGASGVLRSPVTKSPALRKQSRRLARPFATCQLIAPTSIQSNKLSRSSKQLFARLLRERLTPLSKPSLKRAQTSQRKNAQIISPTRVIAANHEYALEIQACAAQGEENAPLLHRSVSARTCPRMRSTRRPDGHSTALATTLREGRDAACERLLVDHTR
jgi:DDE superfamily endonuclease